MNSHYARIVRSGMCLIAVAMLAACAASPAPKVPCDTQLRPINPPQHLQP